MISRILVANRGEIARRVFTTCRRMGISTAAVYTEPDADAPFVSDADVRVRLDTVNGYLDIDSILSAAKASRADAVHPGYGFLSENGQFVEAVQRAGLTWIGPPVDAVMAMGSKIESKKIMAAAGVPILDELDPQCITEDQLPVLVKASAGGGGRGMRVVTTIADLPKEVEAASREAEAAFGDPTVFCERYLPTGHHIEVQVMADTHGMVWTVGERECSIQRHHQKIIEEAPSPLVERISGMRERLFEASQSAAAAIGYSGAGTVEFLADDNGEFFFLEMNTRLQVEHPVTEATTGLDLVELQIQIADGGRLPARTPAVRGHAIEARLYAEDPAANWQPQAGTVHRFRVPGIHTSFECQGRAGIRLDSGIVDGSVVSIHYDPMLAKVISFAPARHQAALALADVLGRSEIHGIRTNRDLLVNILRHPAFLEGSTDTAFFTSHGLTELAAPLADPATIRASAVAAAIADAAHNRATAQVLNAVPSGWRNVVSSNQTKRYRDTVQSEYYVEYLFTRRGLVLPDDDGLRLVKAAGDRVVLADSSGAETEYKVQRYDNTVCVDSPFGGVVLEVIPRFTEPGSAAPEGSLLAPMPGVVIRVGAERGETVSQGQPLLWLEAMKMEHTITAPNDGVLTDLHVAVGTQVEVGAILAFVGQHDSQEGLAQ